MEAAVVLFIATFMVLLVVFAIALSLTGLDLITSFLGALTAMTNVGPCSAR